MLSHDMEDIISVIDGRTELLDEIGQTDDKLKAELARRFAEMLTDERFTDAIPGHLLPDEASQARVPMVMKRIEMIAGKERVEGSECLKGKIAITQGFKGYC